MTPRPGPIPRDDPGFPGPRAAAARAWEQASRVRIFWRSRPGPLQRFLVGLLALAALGVLTIGAIAAIIVGALVTLTIWLVMGAQRLLDRLRGLRPTRHNAPAPPDSSLRRNVRVIGPHAP